MKNLAIRVGNKNIVAYTLESFPLSKDLFKNSQIHLSVNGRHENLDRNCLEYKRLTEEKMKNLAFRYGKADILI